MMMRPRKYGMVNRSIARSVSYSLRNKTIAQANPFLWCFVKFTFWGIIILIIIALIEMGHK